MAINSINDAEKRRLHLKNTDSLIIGSIASVKGLEFEHVVLPFLEEGLLPNSSSKIKDEESLLYVAITRAKNFLTMFSNFEKPSRFVEKMGFGIIEN